MKQLLLSRTNRGIFRDINKLDHDVLIAELAQRGCNMHGWRSILEERLLREKFREEPTLRQIVPWFEFDIEGAEEREPVTMREPLPKRKRTSKQVAPEKLVHFCDERGSDGDSVAHRKRMIVQAEVHAPPPNGRRSGAAAQQPVAVDEYRQTIPRQPLQSREKFVVPDQELMMDEAVYKIVQDGDYQYRAFSRRTQTMPMQALAGEHTQQTVPTFPKPPVPRPRRNLCMLERSHQNELNAENETRQTSRENNNAPRQNHQSASQTQPVVGTNRASNAPQYSVPRVNVNDRDSRGDARRNLFTRWIEVKPLRKADGKSVARVLEELILFRWETPEYFLSDNGKEFDNKLLASVLQEYEVKHVTTAPYHPQSNAVERSNKTLKTMISIFVKNDHRDWDLHVHEFRHATNTAVQASTKMSPAFLNYGRHPTPVKSLRREVERVKTVERIDPQLWADRLKRLDLLRDLVTRHIDSAREKQSREYNKKHKDIRFFVRDQVLRKTHFLSDANKNFAKKIAPDYDGPYTITSVLSDNTYVVRKNDGDDRRKAKVAVSDLKRYLPSRRKT
ncbi:unnamed protein product [Trichogramma brassicae]|uniref:Integrase catalytic domain-containing protein n=1 Tax=Trichogramma brassicae TaxID=86971 RepID=A0A6H5J996_9HYME|nr:unnamed protein product [Trichogramma brassicae]